MIASVWCRPAVRRLAAAAPLAFAACDGGPAAPAPVAPAPVAPVPPSVAVSFVQSRLEVSEGETAEISVRYRVRELASAWTLRLAALPGTASAGDFELVGDGLVIPAGRGVSGEVSTPLRALADRSFAEGSETVTIRFAADPGTGADLGGDLVVVLREAGASPCPGVTVRALAPAPAADDDQFLGTDLTIERSAAGAGTILVLRGPYYWEEWLGEEFAYEPVSATRIVSWASEAAGDSMRDRLKIEWPDGTLLEEPDLVLGFRGGGCSGERTASCSPAGCELAP